VAHVNVSVHAHHAGKRIAKTCSACILSSTQQWLKDGL
jgi:hypothetical protein